MTRKREETLAALVAECLALREAGVEDVPVDRVCAEYPELVADVRRSLEGARRMDRVPGSDLVAADGRERKPLGGRYECVERIGTGAMGVVHSALDLELDRTVAVKVINTAFGVDARTRERFEREAAALAAIQHEGVVRVFDRGVDEAGHPFLVMERIDGVSSSQILELAEERRTGDDTAWIEREFEVRGIEELSWIRQALTWILQVGEGIAAAHAAGVFHRDVKPSNILVRRDGRAVLIDFGIADMIDRTTLTSPGEAMGTPAYMAPEVLAGNARTPAAQDVYGLAATLYHFLTLRPPYVGGPREVLAALATREPSRAVDVRPGLPRDVQAILDHGLARSPQRRYASIEALLQDVRATLRYEPVSVRPTSAVVRVGRRFLRSKVALGVALATLVFGAVLATGAWRAGRMAAAERRFVKSWPNVPANLCLLHPSNRFIANNEARRDTAEALDRVCAAGDQRLEALALRALFRFDHGDPRGAVEDLMRIAKRSGSPLARAAANCIESGDAPSQALADESAVVSTDAGRYLGAVLGVRIGALERATEFVNAVAQPRPRAVEELELVLRMPALTRLDQEKQWIELYDASQQLIDDILELEARDGFVSATTAHMRGYALQRQGRYLEGLDASSESTELGPGTPVAWLNAALGARRAGLLDEARSYAERGLELAPGYVKLEQELAKTEAIAGNAERARELVANANFRDSRSGRRERRILAARVELETAFKLRESDPEESRLAAQRTLDLCEGLPEGNSSRAKFTAISEGLLSGEGTALSRAALEQLSGRPFSIPLLSILVDEMPEELDAATVAALRQWIAVVIDRTATMPEAASASARRVGAVRLRR